MSKARSERLRQYLPALRHQDEDCLYLNLYIPHEEASTMAYPVVVFIHGESYEWGSSSLYDGSVLAAFGKVIVVTLNYRLGILGFFNANVDPVGRAVVTNFGLMDQLAALHWVQENIVHFGGDPGQVTVMGHGTGAACLNFLIVSPTATGAGLFKRAIIMSGSALSPWAFVQEPLPYALQTATQLGCPVPKDLYRQYEGLLQCLRQVPVEEILKVQLQTSPFLVTVGPSVDGVTIKADWKDQLSKMGKEGRTPVDVLMGTTSMNLFEIFSEDEMLLAFDDERRSLLLETFIKNNYRFHLPEITLAIKAAYTDWTKAIEDGNGIRNLTGEALHDASVVSPLTMLACQIHSTFRATYFYVLEHKIEDHYPEQRSNDVLKNELPYIFGGPLGFKSPATSSFNFTKGDVVLSESIIAQWTNFMKFGHPRNLVPVETFGDRTNETTQFSAEWPRFDPIHQRYYELGIHGRSRDHYRAGNVALWSWLVPELERVGSRYGKDSSFEESTQIFPLDHLAGSAQRDFLPRNLLPSYNTTTGSPSTNTSFSGTAGTADAEVHKKKKSGPSETLDARQARNDLQYTTAFSVTVAIACSLLILNMVVLTIVYYRYDSNSRMRNNVQLQVAANPTKPIYHTELYSTLSSSATLHSELAASFEGGNHDWPPDYASSCNVVCRDVSAEKRNSQNIFDRSVLQHPNASSDCRAPALVMRQPLASYTSAVDGQLVPLNFARCKTTEMEV